MAKTFEDFITEERERLTMEREDIFNQQQALEDKLQSINRELAAITAYDDVKKGKAPQPTASAAPKRRGPAPGTHRAPRGSGVGAKQKVLDLIRSHATDGIQAKEIADQLSDIKNIGNVLSALVKEGLIKQSARRQPYFPSAA